LFNKNIHHNTETMKPLPSLKSLSLLILIFSFSIQSKAGLFNFTKQLDSIQLVYNQNELRLPGESFGIGVIAYFKNGKVKKTMNIEKGIMPWFRFTVDVKGGSQFMGRVRVNGELLPSVGKYVQVTVWPNKAKHLAKELLLPLNYEKNIEIVPVSKLVKAPGYGFNFKVVSTFDNGQQREYFYKSYDDLSKTFILAVNGGNLRRDKYVIETDIRNITNHTVNLTAYSKRNPECIHSFDLQLDYKAHYNLTLWGSSGSSGFSGSGGSSGSTGSNGGDGSNGQNGGDGSRSPDIGVWADLYFDEVLNANLLYVYAQNLWTEQEYRFLINPDGGSLSVATRGGSGGNGGSGGSGGNGGNGADGATHSRVDKLTDSTSVTVTWQDPGGNGGHGGNGGYGGHGGDGGNGGDIYLYFTDDALDYQNLIHPVSDGGSSGLGGSGGFGGSGGSGGSGSPGGSSGSSGGSGSSGSSGWSGGNGDIFQDYTDEFVE
jgi:hypothetical protein